MIFDLRANTRLRAAAVSALFAFALLGCAHQPERDRFARDADFTARILDNGTKLFRVAMRQPMPAGRSGGPGDSRNDSGGADCFPCEPGQQVGSRARGGRELDMRKVATAVLEENHYCREGFVVLEQYQAAEGRVLRGECRDAADAGDRQKFTHN